MADYRALGAALTAAEKAGETAHACDIVRLLALTGCRRGEVTGLTWGEVDIEQRLLRLARTKEGYSLRPLGRPAADVLEGLSPRDETDLVFSVGEDQPRPFSDLQRAWERIAKRAQLKEATLHTWRQSFATTANALGCSEPTIAAMLGHSRGTMTSRYVHVVDDVLRAAADRVSGAIAHALAGGKPADLISIEGHRKAVRTSTW
jgi:integrase